MIETYQGTVTEIDDLGGLSWDVMDVTRVCDRCGIQKYEEELIEEEYTHLHVCKDCIDRPGPRTADRMDTGTIGQKASESSTVPHVVPPVPPVGPKDFEPTAFDGGSFE